LTRVAPYFRGRLVTFDRGLAALHARAMMARGNPLSSVTTFLLVKAQP